MNDILGICDQSSSTGKIAFKHVKSPSNYFEEAYVKYLIGRIDFIFSRNNVRSSHDRFIDFNRELEFAEIRSTLKSCLENKEYQYSIINLFSFGTIDHCIEKIWSPTWKTPCIFAYEKNIGKI